MESDQESNRISLGISACLVGENVRYDGGHKRDPYITDILSHYFDLTPVCPEAGVGLGIPRPPIRLVQVNDQVRSLGIDDSTLDPTEKLNAYGHATAARLQHICGYILKSRSPSCGVNSTSIYNKSGHLLGTGSGIFARALMESDPLMPVEEEGRLGDPLLRENFLERVSVYSRWKKLIQGGVTPAGVVDFHSDHKYLILSHDQTSYRELGRIVADSGVDSIDALAQRYIKRLMAVLKTPATPENHVNVLQHLMGHLKKTLESDDRQELLDSIESYRLGSESLQVPIALLQYHLRRNPDPYVDRQFYLKPYAMELMMHSRRQGA